METQESPCSLSKGKEGGVLPVPHTHRFSPSESENLCYEARPTLALQGPNLWPAD